MKKVNLASVFCSILMFCTSSAYANMLFILEIIEDTNFPYPFQFIAVILLLVISVEAALLYMFLKNISYLKALGISFVGNFVSETIGTISMTFVIIGWHLLFDIFFLRGAFHPLNTIASWIAIYLGTTLLESLVIRIVFGYSFKKLFVPVFIGNFITYALAATVLIYTYPVEFTLFIKNIFR